MAGGHVEYHEPGAKDLLVLASFMYLLNVARWIADRVLYAGLLGEVLVGIVFGPPLANILQDDWQQTFLSLGYLGLVLIVFEGGLDFEPSLFLDNAILSLIVAFTGITMPIALSFALLRSAFGYSSLQAFAAGAALSSTSLGTTFFVLQASSKAEPTINLIKTRIGTILVAAALIDDVVGLVMLSVLSSLNTDPEQQHTSIGWSIGRPILTAVLMAGVFPLAFFLLKRFVQWHALWHFARNEHLRLFSIVALLSALVAVAFWAGTSMLLGAFLAGICLALLPGLEAAQVFAKYIKPAHERILEPLFFASIGTSIPFLELFTGKRLWRGLIYALLMALAKLAVAVWPVIWGRAHRSALAPALFVGTALVARGEIGVLIATIVNAPPKQIVGNEAYLDAMWAILVCTAVGPPLVGLIIRRYGRSIVEGPWGADTTAEKARAPNQLQDEPSSETSAGVHSPVLQ